MTSTNPLPQPEGTTSQLLTISLSNIRFTIPEHLAPKRSILDTKEPHIDLTFILSTYLGSLLLELFSVHLTWLHTHDVTQLIKDENSAIRVTKATMLLQIAAALEDEEFRIPATKYLEGLYREYDGEFGPVVKPFWEW